MVVWGSMCEPFVICESFGCFQKNPEFFRCKSPQGPPLKKKMIFSFQIHTAVTTTTHPTFHEILVGLNQDPEFHALYFPNITGSPKNGPNLKPGKIIPKKLWQILGFRVI